MAGVGANGENSFLISSLDLSDEQETHAESGNGMKEDDDEVFVGKEVSLPRKKSVLKRESRAGLPKGEKRVSFSSSPSEKRVSNASDCFEFMEFGTEFLKIRPGGRQYQRWYQFDKATRTLLWRSMAKKPEKAQLPADLIYEIRAGKHTSIFHEHGSDYNDACCFSIIVGSSFDSIDLVAKCPDDANIWVTGIRLLIGDGITQDLEEHDLRERWLMQQFKIADTESKGILSEKEVLQLLKRLRVSAPLSMIHQKFHETLAKSNNSTESGLDEEDFISFFKDLTTRPEIYFLLVKYSSSGSYLTTDDLIIFLESEQGLTWAGKEYALDIVNRYEPSEEGRRNQILGIDGLTRYFQDKDCDIFNPEQLRVSQDMKRPLSSYFIASSHNTYLLEDQLAGKSSVQGYIRALQRGCRCVELDCWDGPNNEPIIYHGKTLTSKIRLCDALVAIRDHAFLASPYPLILSIENHCSLRQQKTMASLFVEILREKLYTTPVNEALRYLPSPETLRGKIIIKNKRLPDAASSEDGYVSEEAEDEDTMVWGMRGGVTDENRNGSLGQDARPHALNKTDNNITQAHQKMKLARELSDLVNLCKAMRFQSFQQSFERQRCWEMCSFGETTAHRLCHTTPEEFISYNKKFLSRIYPAGKRVDSSNFNPQEFWNCGCQLVALNYQYPGLAMDLNRGFFARNGNCGYILKPALLRDEIAYFNPNIKGEIAGISPLTIQVKIISGYQLQKPRGSTAKGDVVDPFVSVEIHGIPGDTKSERTRTVPHNGFNPLFDESFEFRINFPELAQIRFIVLDDDFIGDGFIGQYTLPVDCLQQGYRTVKLLSSTGECLAPSSLFVHVTVSRPHELTSWRFPRFSIVKSLRKNKEFTSLKSLGVKKIDDTFKLAIQPLREATNLRENFQVCLNAFKDSCGLTPRSNIKQCIRILARRFNNAPDTKEGLVKMALVVTDEFPQFCVEGQPPAHLQRVLDAFDQLLEESRTLVENASSAYERLNHARRCALEWHTSLPRVFAQEKLKERRATKAMENFSWNVRVLKGQADLLKDSLDQCEEYMKQVQEAGLAAGLVPSCSESL